MLIYNGVDKNIFIIINTYTSAKEAWETLEFSNQGTSKFRMSRLQLPTTKFQNLKIKEEETNVEFNVWLCHIANNSFSLGEKMLEEKLARKILRSILKRFDIKVTSIGEVRGVGKLKVDEFDWIHSNFGNDNKWKIIEKSKSMVFKAEVKEDDDQIKGDADENLTEYSALLAISFSKSMWSLRRSMNNVTSNVKDNEHFNSKGFNFQCKGKYEEKQNNGKEIECHECEGFGYI